MDNPFPKSSSTPGEGHIIAQPSPDGFTRLQKVTYQYPLKIISPSTSSSSYLHRRSALVFLLSYGGGLVAGDEVDLTVNLISGARLSIVTQGYTKIFRTEKADVVTRQQLRVRIEKDAACCLLPDPVQPFRESNYEQTQIFDVTTRSSVCLLDWVTQGRAARGESWDFTRYLGRNEIWLSDDEGAGAGTGAVEQGSSRGMGSQRSKRLLVRDTIILAAEEDGTKGATKRSLRETMHRLGVFGTLILRGPLMEALGKFFVDEFAALPRIGARDFRTAEASRLDQLSMSPLEHWRQERVAQESRDGVLWSAALVRSCVVVKFGAHSVEGGRDWLGCILRREGSIVDVFGEQALLCLR